MKGSRPASACFPGALVNRRARASPCFRRGGGWIRGLIAGVLLTIGLAAAGCASAVLAPRIVTAPNVGGHSPTLLSQAPETRVALARLYARTLRVPVPGSQPAEIALAVLEPGDYRHTRSVTVQPDSRGRPHYHVDSHWEPLSDGPPRLEPTATIVLLHGFWMSREAVLHWGLHLAEAGYRTVLVDMRGHGASTGAWVTFGALEAADLSAVLDTLQREGLAGPRIGVLGVSYGASVGLQWAARDPRVRAIVALEPFADARLAIRQYARAVLSPAANRALSDGAITAATRRAGRLAGFRWEATDVAAAVGRLQVPVLFVHGTADTVIPADHSRRLHALAPAGSRLVEVPGEDHFTLSMRLEPFAAEVEAWFAAAFSGSGR